MNIEDIKRVLIIGAGTMGQQISVPCSIHGYEVVMYDIKEDMLKDALVRIKKMMDKLVSRGSITQSVADAAMGRITTNTDPEKAAAGIDIVSESVPEDPALKIKVFSMFNTLCRPDTIFTTNTSTLLPSMFAEGTGRPDKFAALHFHNVMVTTVVDVMPHPGTSEETVNLVYEFSKRIGQTPILLRKENNGYVFNAMIVNLFGTALTLATDEITSVENIDKAWMGVTHMPIGPFGLMDSIGLDTVWKITEMYAKKTKKPKQLKNAEFLKAYVDKGYLGQKSNHGFYTYPKPAFSDPDFLKKY